MQTHARHAPSVAEAVGFELAEQEVHVDPYQDGALVGSYIVADGLAIKSQKAHISSSPNKLQIYKKI